VTTWRFFIFILFYYICFWQLKILIFNFLTFLFPILISPLGESHFLSPWTPSAPKSLRPILVVTTSFFLSTVTAITLPPPAIVMLKPTANHRGSLLVTNRRSHHCGFRSGACRFKSGVCRQWGLRLPLWVSSPPPPAPRTFIFFVWAAARRYSKHGVAELLLVLEVETSELERVNDVGDDVFWCWVKTG